MYDNVSHAMTDLLAAGGRDFVIEMHLHAVATRMLMKDETAVAALEFYQSINSEVLL